MQAQSQLVYDQLVYGKSRPVSHLIVPSIHSSSEVDKPKCQVLAIPPRTRVSLRAGGSPAGGCSSSSSVPGHEWHAMHLPVLVVPVQHSLKLSRQLSRSCRAWRGCGCRGGAWWRFRCWCGRGFRSWGGRGWSSRGWGGRGFRCG